MLPNNHLSQTGWYLCYNRSTKLTESPSSRRISICVLEITQNIHVQSCQNVCVESFYWKVITITEFLKTNATTVFYKHSCTNGLIVVAHSPFFPDILKVFPRCFFQPLSVNISSHAKTIYTCAVHELLNPIADQRKSITASPERPDKINKYCESNVVPIYYSKKVQFIYKRYSEIILGI